MTAGYAMAEIFIGDKLMLLPGVRYGADGGRLSRLPRAVRRRRRLRVERAGHRRRHQRFLLPGFHLRYAIDGRRTSARRSRARWRGRTTTTSCRINWCSRRTRRSRAATRALKPTTSGNRRSAARAILPVGGRRVGRRLLQAARTTTFPVPLPGRRSSATLYEVTQPRNGDRASLWGMEVAFQNRFRVPAGARSTAWASTPTTRGPILRAQVPGADRRSRRCPDSAAHRQLSRLVRESAGSRRGWR